MKNTAALDMCGLEALNTQREHRSLKLAIKCTTHPTKSEIFPLNGVPQRNQPFLSCSVKSIYSRRTQRKAHKKQPIKEPPPPKKKKIKNQQNYQDPKKTIRNTQKNIQEQPRTIKHHPEPPRTPKNK